MYRARIDSFNELPKDKRPPRGLWDKPYRLSKFFDELWGSDGKKKTKTEFIEWDEDEVE